MAEETEISFKPGVWQGKYLDAFGYRGELKLETESKGEEISGKFELVLASEDRPKVVTGTVSGKQANGFVQLRMIVGKNQEPIEYDAHIMNAGAYATQCLSGMVTAPRKSDFGGGVWIAWRFKKGNQ